tara:strand:- start:9847 stop:10797 length:951 start_codon:yes stop_codon:yes gene_type:complete
MRQTFLLALLAFVVVISIYWYQGLISDCPVPLSYRVGTIDESFGLDEDTARGHIESAIALWESETDRNLFEYDEKADLKVDFVFDERQAEANTEEKLRELLDAKRGQNQTVIKTVEEMQTTHEELFDDYQSQVGEYEARLDDYNQRVKIHNDRGGAPADVFSGLEEEREELNQLAEGLSDTAAKLNQLAEDINELGQRGNEMVDDYNKQVDAYNSKYGFSREFTQGDYQQNVINIYKFSSTNELVKVLTHELGHALGIGHVEDASSVMYYLLEGTDDETVLSGDDLAAYYEICGMSESFSQKTRRVFRGFVSNVVS